MATDEPVTLRGVPDITDARQIIDLFQRLGSEVHVDFETGELRVCHAGALSTDQLRKVVPVIDLPAAPAPDATAPDARPVKPAEPHPLAGEDTGTGP